jgi:hypothetical protein
MPRIYIPVDKQRTVIARAQGRCEYCQSWSGCNGRKYNKMAVADPVDGQMAPLFNPRQQPWPEHFCWSDDYTRVIGVTATGRATVEALGMNRPGRPLPAVHPALPYPDRAVLTHDTHEQPAIPQDGFNACNFGGSWHK